MSSHPRRHFLFARLSGPRVSRTSGPSPNRDSDLKGRTAQCIRLSRVRGSRLTERVRTRREREDSNLQGHISQAPSRTHGHARRFPITQLSQINVFYTIHRMTMTASRINTRGVRIPSLSSKSISLFSHRCFTLPPAFWRTADLLRPTGIAPGYPRTRASPLFRRRILPRRGRNADETFYGPGLIGGQEKLWACPVALTPTAGLEPAALRVWTPLIYRLIYAGISRLPWARPRGAASASPPKAEKRTIPSPT